MMMHHNQQDKKKHGIRSVVGIDKSRWANLITGVEFTVHETSDDARFSYALISQEH